jgi:cytochrome P450
MAIYNVFFHPLKNYPGPWILAASRLPITYANITGRSSHWALYFHEKYGPVVRMAPNELSYSDSSSWKDIYGSHPTRPAGMPRDPAFWETLDDVNDVPSLFNASNIDHSRIRRAYSKAFSKHAIIAQESLIAEHVTYMIRNVYKQQHQPINIVDLFAYTMVDIMADLQLGEPLRLLDDTTYHYLIKSQFGLIRNSNILATLADFPFIKVIFQLVLPRLIKKAHVVYFGWMNTKLDLRFTARTNRPDIVHFVMEQNRPDAKISEAGVRANLPIISIAQTETTTTALSGLIALLSGAPQVLQQLQDEVRSTFHTSSDINMVAMEKLEVLNACINEALRIYPAIPGALPRLVPQGSAIISGQCVPGGTRVYNSPLATFRSSANFHDPGSFLPRRWYAKSNNEFSRDDKGAWKPFSVGTKDCIGKK